MMTKWVTIDGGKWHLKDIEDPALFKRLNLKMGLCETKEEMLPYLVHIVPLFILGWDEIEDANGVPIPYTHKFAAQVLLQDHDLLAKVYSHAGAFK